MLLDALSKKEAQVKPFDTGDKIGYALGDIGCGTFFQFVIGYLMVFYTDVFGIPAAAVGTLFVVARIWDAINDPIMGIIVDKKGATKHGKFRPYIIYFGIPMILVGILCFTSFTALPQNMKLVYAYISYILFGMLYTAVNIPYGSLSSVMTTVPEQRTSLSTFRNIGSMASGIIVMVLAPSLIYTNNQATASGFLTAAIVFGIISLICFILTFRLTRERVQHPNNANPKILSSMKSLFKNRAFIGIALSSFFCCATMFMASGLNAYLYKEYFNNVGLMAIGGMTSMVASLVIIPFVGPIAKKFGKREASIGGTIWAMIFYAILFFFPIRNPFVFMGISMIAGLGTGAVNALTWALVADAIDYQEYISGDRNEGTVYSTYSLFRKLAQALSGGTAAFALEILGYQTGATTQLPGIGLGIKNTLCGAYFIGQVLSLIALIFVFNLSKKKLDEMNEALAERRKTSTV